MESFGQTIQKLRKERGLPLRTVAAFLDIDQAILSKIESGQRKSKREQVLQLANFFHVEEKEFIVLWLSDKLMYELSDEDDALKALQVAEARVRYQTLPKERINSIISSISEVLTVDGRVAAAWLFGSMSRMEANPTSDVDLIVELNKNQNYSMFDILDLAHVIGSKIKRKVDIVEKGHLKNFALETANQNVLKIYG
jgi:predicted nucleotidyltransferase